MNGQTGARNMARTRAERVRKWETKIEKSETHYVLICLNI